MLTVGLYWTVFGLWFAVGLVLSIYVHEMGHVFALTRYGIHAGAPLFVPGLGAFIRLKQELTDPKQDARVGLAGPIWGLGAALVCLAAFVATRQPIWAALAQFGALVNLFNLLPIWHLDGGRAFRSLTRSRRWLAVAAIAAAWAVTDEGLLVLLLIGGVARTRHGQTERQTRRRSARVNLPFWSGFCRRSRQCPWPCLADAVGRSRFQAKNAGFLPRR